MGSLDHGEGLVDAHAKKRRVRKQVVRGKVCRSRDDVLKAHHEAQNDSVSPHEKV